MSPKGTPDTPIHSLALSEILPEVIYKIVVYRESDCAALLAMSISLTKIAGSVKSPANFWECNVAANSARSQAILDQLGVSHAQGAVETLVTHAERMLHQDILNGVHSPGARLNIRALSEQYEIGATPLREALTKLAATGFVTIVENRGFRVSRLSHEDLLDIVTARQLIEVGALRESMREGGAEWEAGIVAALQKIDHFARRSGPDGPDWADGLDTVHKEFHTALLMAAGSARLIAIHQMLYDQTFRYRQVMFTGLPSIEEFVEDHRGLASVVLARDIEAACARLSHHLTHTLRAVYPDNTKA